MKFEQRDPRGVKEISRGLRAKARHPRVFISMDRPEGAQIIRLKSYFSIILTPLESRQKITLALSATLRGRSPNAVDLSFWLFVLMNIFYDTNNLRPPFGGGTGWGAVQYSKISILLKYFL